MRLPGLADVHVHLRVPGGEQKEDIRSGTSAALAGGFTTILCMPNTRPPLIHPADIRRIQEQIRVEALCDVHPFAGLSAETLDQLPELGKEAAGLKIYMDQTFGPLRITDLSVLEAAFSYFPAERVIALHAEGQSIAAGLGLAAAYGHKVHFCHVSRGSEIELIAAAKARGLPVTCEVTPHHLFLNQDDLPRLGALGDMRPVLAAREDVAALWEHINTTIDCIATDHAPHTLDEKKAETGSPPGVPGLETALPLMLTAVSQGKLSMQRLVELMAVNPRRIFGLPAQPDTWVEVDPDANYQIPENGFFTRCNWSPFSGMPVKGKVREVMFKGKIVFQNGIIVH